MINNMVDYTTIENPYNDFVDRTIQSEVPVSPDQIVREGTSVKDLWVTAFIRSVNWKPHSVGFNIDGTTGDAEFNNVAIKGTITGSSIYLPNETNPLFSVDSSGNATVSSLRRKDLVINLNFESTEGLSDGNSGGGVYSVSGSGLRLNTNGASGGIACAVKGTSSTFFNSALSWTKKRHLKTFIHITNISDQVGYLLVGGTSGPSIDTSKHFGFKIVNGTIYGHTADGTAATTTTGVAIYTNNSYALEAIYYPAEKAEFYVNGTLIGTSATNLPFDAAGADHQGVFMVASLEQTAAGTEKQLISSFWEFWQEQGY